MISQKGIEPPKGLELDPVLQQHLLKWLTNLHLAFPKVQTFSESLDVANVGAGSESVQNFTITGLTTSDVVIVNKPSNNSGLDMSQAWVSAADTLTIKFRNVSGGAINPSAETYRIIAIRL